MNDGPQTDVATLTKFVTLDPKPVAATWSVGTIGKDDLFGPTDTELWAVLRYSDADFTSVSHALKAGGLLKAATTGAPPAWLAKEADLALFQHGSDDTLDGPVFDAKPFASDLYASGLAVVRPNHRVVIHFSSR